MTQPEVECAGMSLKCSWQSVHLNHWSSVVSASLGVSGSLGDEGSCSVCSHARRKDLPWPILTTVEGTAQMPWWTVSLSSQTEINPSPLGMFLPGACHSDEKVTHNNPDLIHNHTTSASTGKKSTPHLSFSNYEGMFFIFFRKSYLEIHHCGINSSKNGDSFSCPKSKVSPFIWGQFQGKHIIKG